MTLLLREQDKDGSDLWLSVQWLEDAAARLASGRPMRARNRFAHIALAFTCGCASTYSLPEDGGALETAVLRFVIQDVDLDPLQFSLTPMGVDLHYFDSGCPKWKQGGTYFNPSYLGSLDGAEEFTEHSIEIPAEGWLFVHTKRYEEGLGGTLCNLWFGWVPKAGHRYLLVYDQKGRFCTAHMRDETAGELVDLSRADDCRPLPRR